MDYEVYRQKLASSGQTADEWHREANSWFDGSVESVDRRLAMCNLLLARSEERYARNMGAKHDLKAIIDLQASQRYLRALRDDLLTASQDKSAGPELGGPAPQFTPVDPPPNINDNLKQPWVQDTMEGRNPLEPGSLTHGIIHSHKDQRWIALEAAKFYRANDEATSEELLIRARNHAELKTSTRSKADSQAITSAFVQKVAALAEDAPKRRVSSVPRKLDTNPDEVLFM